jgi:hypothetical protein
VNDPGTGAGGPPEAESPPAPATPAHDGDAATPAAPAAAPRRSRLRALASKITIVRALLVVALLMLSAGGVYFATRDPSAKICTMNCGCMGAKCRIKALANCHESMEQAKLAAEARSCMPQFDAVISCTLAKSKCVDGHFVPGHCREVVEALHACAGRKKKIFY